MVTKPRMNQIPKKRLVEKLSGSEAIPHTLQNRNVHYRVQPVPILSQLNPANVALCFYLSHCGVLWISKAIKFENCIRPMLQQGRVTQTYKVKSYQVPAASIQLLRQFLKTSGEQSICVSLLRILFILPWNHQRMQDTEENAIRNMRQKLRKYRIYWEVRWCPYACRY